ncbi:hypothetical protein IAD21_01436 [Abditibacteriota bacterium]|nr:hypothetical protein IAD21_01436 [Abditibacteriota bacterium]
MLYFSIAARSPLNIGKLTINLHTVEEVLRALLPDDTFDFVQMAVKVRCNGVDAQR